MSSRVEKLRYGLNGDMYVYYGKMKINWYHVNDDVEDTVEMMMYKLYVNSET